MAQFRVYRNPQPDSKHRFPLLLDIQSDLIGALGTRVVVPLMPLAAKGTRALTVLMPAFDVDGRKYAMCTPQLAGVPKGGIGAEVADLASRRDEIIAALDLLVSGF
ncbi:MAG: CcdB family protein [Steroidobacteraceae bacterium]